MIKLFKATDKTYSTNGDVVLETAKARVHKEDNGDFYIDVEAPLKENKKEASYDEGQTIEGTDFSINVDLFKQNELTTLKGNTTQASTPTPDNPVPVNVVSGGQNILSNNTNLIGLDTQQYRVSLKAGDKVTMKNQGTRTLQLNLYTNYGDTTRNDYWSLQAGATRTITVAHDSNAIAWNVEPNGLAWANKGNTLLEYEECKSTFNSINLGNNLFDISTSNYIYKCTLSDDIYTTSPMNSENRNVVIGYTPNTKWTIYPNETYYISADIRLKSGTTNGSMTTLSFNISGTRTTTINPTLTNEFQRYVGTYKNNTESPIITGRILLQFNTTGLSDGVFEIKNVMVSKNGNSTYTPYKTPIELCKINDYQDFIRKGTGKNLFSSELELGNINGTTGQLIASTSCVRTKNFIEVKPNTTYTIFNSNLYQQLVYFYQSDETYISNTSSFQNTFTFTTPSNTKYIRVRSSANLTQNDLTTRYQLELGNQATLFEPYGYKDKWYLYKAIGKFTYNNEGSVSTPATNYYNISGLTNQGWNLTVNSSNYISTEYPSASIQNTDANFRNITANMDYAFGLHVGGTGIRFKDIRGLTASQFKADLIGTTIYFALATPTTTEITDSELISQLEGIELLQGLNNVSVSSGDLSGIITIHYNYVNGYNTSLKYIDYLVPNNIIVANTPQGEQAFRISNVENTRTKIKIKAYHVFYDTENLLIEDSYVVDKNCNDALDHLNNATSDTSPFTTISNINTIANYRCVRKSLYEAIQVVLDRWGGHLVRNNWTIGIYDTIGQDNGVTIRYAKNLKNITATYIWDDVVTKLLPVGKDGLLLNAIDPDASIYVESAMQYDIPYTKTISFSQNSIVEDDYKDESGTLDEDAYKQALVDDLYAQAIEYINNNYLPKVNYNLSANVEKVSDIGDTIEVIDEKLGINVMTNIISYDYDCILDKYIELQFGNFTPQLNSLLQTINDNTEKIVQEENNTLAITLGRELDEATSKIWGALGNSYVIYDGDKILVVDSLPKETATNVIMINNGGIGFSNTGITGTFNSAWTIDNVLNMEQINVINLTADLIKGGTLKLGSNLNQNGKIEVFDEANNLIAELNKNGLKMYGVDGSYVLMNNQVGFAGYDRNNNKIYWVDKDEFHMKKSVVEEEITLVGKMRIIPITIRNGNTIVNDGIGFINVAS